MIVGSFHGRLAADPRPRNTSTGTEMAGGFMLVDLEVRDDDPLSVPIGITAFGRAAQELLRIQKGERLTVAGYCQGNRFESRGETKEQMQVVAETVIGPRSARSTPRKKKPDA